MKTTRIQKARMIAANGFNKIAQFSAAGQPTAVFVPGSNGKQYMVIIRRVNGCLSTECLLQTGYGHKDCKGNRYVTVCYHSLSALISVARAGGFQITAIAKTRPDAERRARIGGDVMEIRSHQGGKSMYVVFEPLP